jgi:hypothetical protein
MEDLGQFLFLAAGAVGLFTFLSVAHWVNAQSAERQARERFALLRKVVEQPTESAALVLELLREDEVRAGELERKKERKSRRDGMLLGMVAIAFGLALMATFALVMRRNVWALGLIPLFVGTVVFVFSALNRPAEESLARAIGSRVEVGQERP